jgi:hypothetical protein
LNSFEFSRDMVEVLTLGLTWVRTRVRSWREVQIDAESSYHSLAEDIKSHFARMRDRSKNVSDKPSYNPRLFVENERIASYQPVPEVLPYLKACKESIDNQLLLSKGWEIDPVVNLSKRHAHALHEIRDALSQNAFDLIQSDKQGGIVAVDLEWTLNEMKRHIDMTDHYVMIRDGHLQSKRDEIIRSVGSQLYQLVIGLSKGDKFTEQELEFLLSRVHHPIADKAHHMMSLTQFPYFRLLIKDHKPDPIKKGRPIISSTQWLTREPSIVVTEKLKTVMTWLENQIEIDGKLQFTVLANSAQLVKQLMKRRFVVPEGKKLWLMSADFESLYTFLKLEDVMAALDWLSDYAQQRLFLIPKWLKPLIRFVLTNNYFTCLGSLFKQIWGQAMGTNMAVLVANITLLVLELKHQLANPNSMLRKSELSLLRRYIDDLFGAFIATEEELMRILSELRAVYPAHLELNIQVSEGSVEFLDLEIYLGDLFESKGLLDTKLFEKPFASHEYVRPDSDHHPGVLNGLYSTEMRRILVACSSSVDYAAADRILRARIRHRGWDSWLVNRLKALPFSARESVVTKAAAASGKKRSQVPMLWRTEHNINDARFLPTVGRLIRADWDLLPQMFRAVYPRPIVCNRIRPALLSQLLSQKSREKRYPPLIAPVADGADSKDERRLVVAARPKVKATRMLRESKTPQTRPSATVPMAEESHELESDQTAKRLKTSKDSHVSRFFAIDSTSSASMTAPNPFKRAREQLAPMVSDQKSSSSSSNPGSTSSRPRLSLSQPTPSASSRGVNTGTDSKRSTAVSPYFASPPLSQPNPVEHQPDAPVRSSKFDSMTMSLIMEDVSDDTEESGRQTRACPVGSFYPGHTHTHTHPHTTTRTQIHCRSALTRSRLTWSS